MVRRLLSMWVAASFIVAAYAQEAPIQAEVSFSRQIAPVLARNCLECHSAENSKGKYRVDTFQQVLAPGASKQPPVQAGKPEESALFQRLITPDEDDRMPQDAEPLAADVLNVFRDWIAQGARLDQGNPATPLAELIPHPESSSAPQEYSRAVPILALAFSPSGAELAVSGYHEVTIWGTNGTLITRLSKAPRRVHGLAYHPGGEHLLVAGGQPGVSGEVSIFNLATGARETTLMRSGDEVLALAIDAEGKRFAAGGADNSIHLFDWERREKVLTVQQHADWVTALQFSADGQKLASASRDRTARLYAAASGELITTYPGFNAPLYAVAVLTEGVVAAGGRGKTVHLWGADEGRKVRELTGTGEVLELRNLGEEIYSAGADGVVRKHDHAGKLLQEFTGHRAAVFSLAVHSIGTLASGSFDGKVRLWDGKEGKFLLEFTAVPTALGRNTAMTP